MPGMWEKCLHSSALHHLLIGLEALLGLSLANVFASCNGFRVVDTCPVFTWMKTPDSFCCSPCSVCTLPLQRQKVYELTFPTILSPGHLYRLRLENPAPPRIWTQALVMTDGQWHPSYWVPGSWSKRTGWTAGRGSGE